MLMCNTYYALRVSDVCDARFVVIECASATLCVCVLCGCEIYINCFASSRVVMGAFILATRERLLAAGLCVGVCESKIE